MHSLETQTRALALYIEQGTIASAAATLKEEGIDVDESSIHRWSKELEGFTSELQAKRKESLADAWYGIATDGVTRVSKAMKSLPDSQVTVPAAIATDKWLKLTEETPASTGTSISVFVGVKVEP